MIFKSADYAGFQEINDVCLNGKKIDMSCCVLICLVSEGLSGEMSYEQRIYLGNCQSVFSTLSGLVRPGRPFQLMYMK